MFIHYASVCFMIYYTFEIERLSIQFFLSTHLIIKKLQQYKNNHGDHGERMPQSLLPLGIYFYTSKFSKHICVNHIYSYSYNQFIL